MSSDRETLEVHAPVTGEYDVAVAGGGSSGVAAALAAAREGLRVVLVEAQSLLGGRTQEGAWVVGGLFRDLVVEAHADGVAVLPSAPRDSTEYHPYG